MISITGIHINCQPADDPADIKDRSHQEWIKCYGLDLAVSRAQRWTRGGNYPHGTLVVNLLGCFFIGLLSHLLEHRGFFGVEARLFVFIGLLGAFTTFSTFGNETVNLLRGGNTFYALGNIAIHVVLGLGMVWLGRALGESV